MTENAWLGCVTPLNDRILVRRIDGESVSAGGIHIPDTAKEKPAKGTVVACGMQVGSVHGGETVLFSKYAGTELRLDDVDHLILREDEILAVVR